jgi:hypothetical protein
LSSLRVRTGPRGSAGRAPRPRRHQLEVLHDVSHVRACYRLAQPDPGRRSWLRRRGGFTTGPISSSEGRALGLTLGPGTSLPGVVRHLVANPPAGAGERRSSENKHRVARCATRPRRQAKPEWPEA